MIEKCASDASVGARICLLREYRVVVFTKMSWNLERNIVQAYCVVVLEHDHSI